MKTKYRIITDGYSGYEIQYRKWWYPFWCEFGISNTHQSPEKAKEWLIRYLKMKYEKPKREVVEYL